LEAVRTLPALSNRKTGRNALPQKWDRLLFWFAFFMAFPAIVIVQNITIYIFGLIVFFILQYVRRPLISMNKPLQWVALFFGVGAVVSVLNIPPEAASNSIERALAVLPNYLYWSFLIIIFITHRRLIELDNMSKAIFLGLLVTVAYFLFLQPILRVIPIFNRVSPNTFAFLLICYSPLAVYYLKQKKGQFWATVFLALLVLILLRDGRRAGMVLVFLGGMAVLYADQVNWKRLFLGAAVIPLLIAGLYTSPVEAFLLQSSERIHGLIYETGKIRTEDRSYLTRVAMVNKGLAIYEKYPYTGIGLNNFTNFETDFDKSFEGAAYVIYKENLNQKSAHNSYINVLSEGGLFLLVPLILLLASNMLFLLLNYNSLPGAYRPVFIGLVGMSIHMYFINDIVNVFAWFLIALASALRYKYKK